MPLLFRFETEKKAATVERHMSPHVTHLFRTRNVLVVSDSDTLQTHSTEWKVAFSGGSVREARLHLSCLPRSLREESLASLSHKVAFRSVPNGEEHVFVNGDWVASVSEQRVLPPFAIPIPRKAGRGVVEAVS